MYKDIPIKSRHSPPTPNSGMRESGPKKSPGKLGLRERGRVSVPSLVSVDAVVNAVIWKLVAGLAGGVRMTTPFGSFPSAEKASVCSLNSKTSENFLPAFPWSQDMSRYRKVCFWIFAGGMRTS